MAAHVGRRIRTRRIRGIPTHVVELPASNTEHGAPPTVLVVPGSPGAGEFYLPFAENLQERFHRKVNVAVVSHAGHSPGCYRDGCEFETQSTAIAKDDRRWFSLEDQVQHKLAYLEDSSSVSPSSQLILIGHSIGCYVVLQMLKQLPPDRVRKVVLLFPTMERLSESRNGRKLRKFFSGLLKLLCVFIVAVLSCLPYAVQKMLVNVHLSRKGMNYPHIFEGSMHITNTGSCYNILSMAHQEMQEVTELDASMLEKHGHKCVSYYGEHDKWVPDDVYAITKERFPLCDVVQDHTGCQHAFVEKEADWRCVAEFVHSRVEV